MMSGQMAEMKITQMAAGLAALNTSRPMGSQASGDTGRSRLMMGEAMAWMNGTRPMRKPSGMPMTAAMPNPRPTRFSELRMFQPMPWSLGPFT
jgi:hypothetical protein